MAKSKAELIYDIENELVDPTTNKITGERVKARLLDMVATMAESAGSGGGGGSSTMEYWGVPAGYESDAMAELGGLCLLGKFNLDGVTGVMSAGLAIQFYDSAIAFAFDPNIKLAYPGIGLATAKEILARKGVTNLSAIGLTPITEEEFYTI